MSNLDGFMHLIRLKCTVEESYRSIVLTNNLCISELAEEREALEAECNRINRLFRDSLVDMATFKSTWTWEKIQEIQAELHRFHLSVITYPQKCCSIIEQRLADQRNSL
jgi:hypothetical protein